MKTDWQEISKNLYEAIVQMRKRSGLHSEDMDKVFDATEAYEVAVGEQSGK